MSANPLPSCRSLPASEASPLRSPTSADIDSLLRPTALEDVEADGVGAADVAPRPTESRRSSTASSVVSVGTECDRIFAEMDAEEEEASSRQSSTTSITSSTSTDPTSLNAVSPEHSPPRSDSDDGTLVEVEVNEADAATPQPAATASFVAFSGALLERNDGAMAAEDDAARASPPRSPASVSESPSSSSSASSTSSSSTSSPSSSSTSSTSSNDAVEEQGEECVAPAQTLAAMPMVVQPTNTDLTEVATTAAAELNNCGHETCSSDSVDEEDKEEEEDEEDEEDEGDDEGEEDEEDEVDDERAKKTTAARKSTQRRTRYNRGRAAANQNAVPTEQTRRCGSANASNGKNKRIRGGADEQDVVEKKKSRGVAPSYSS